MAKIIHMIFLLLLSGSCFALEARYPFERSEYKNRFEHLVQSYRCVVCENQTLAESEATLARDLRVVIYQKIQAGETDSQIDLYLKNRFGSFIQYKPAFAMNTALLWLGPLVFLLLGVLLIWRQTRHKN